MNSLDNSIENLRNILTEFSSFVESKGTVGETDTRVKVIDRILKEVLNKIDRLRIIIFKNQKKKTDLRCRYLAKSQLVKCNAQLRGCDANET